jgi:hypothetical protein
VQGLRRRRMAGLVAELVLYLHIFLRVSEKAGSFVWGLIPVRLYIVDFNLFVKERIYVALIRCVTQ